MHAASLSLWSTASTNLILDLKRSQSLMVEHLADMAPVEVEMGVAEVDECDASDEQECPGVVALSRWLERIITDFITVWQVMDVVLFFPSVSTSVAREVVIVTKLYSKEDVVILSLR